MRSNRLVLSSAINHYFTLQTLLFSKLLRYFKIYFESLVNIAYFKNPTKPNILHFFIRFSYLHKLRYEHYIRPVCYV